MDFRRDFWIEKIERAWREKPVVWLAGVRRIGKTVLCRLLDRVEYFDCELPGSRMAMENPELFLASMRGKRLVLDEIHRLPNPSELLKICADHFKDVQITATGSSILGASAKFRDTLTDRKKDVWLTPMNSSDMSSAGNESLEHRLLHGGLPGFFLSPEAPFQFMAEWVDQYWSRDIQEMFRLERRSSFVRFIELLMARSGGIFEAAKFARDCEASHTTVRNYLSVLESTYLVHVIRPYSSHKATEIVAAPKVYGFDTGFVCFFSGIDSLRNEDKGRLWEHFVLNELYARFGRIAVQYWRDKQHHEIDFVIKGNSGTPVAIECKWKAESFDPSSLRVFHKSYPDATNIAVAPNVTVPFTRTIDEMTVRFVNHLGLLEELPKHVRYL
jgi:predicted AAA+ superfamily ATPase